jgi:hypothetical protein
MKLEMSVEIVFFRPEHASELAQLNRQWLEEYNLMEAFKRRAAR